MHRAGLEIIRDVVDGYVLVAFDKPLCPLTDLWEYEEPELSVQGDDQGNTMSDHQEPEEATSTAQTESSA